MKVITGSWFLQAIHSGNDLSANRSANDLNVELSEYVDSSAPAYVLSVGQIFKSHDEARIAHLEYASRIGFDVRMGTTKVVLCILSQRRMVCTKQEFRLHGNVEDTVEPRKKRRLGNMRCGCEVLIYLVLDQVHGFWHVVMFVEQHNHEMVSLSKRHYLPVNRVISSLSKALFQSLSSSNIGPND